MWLNTALKQQPTPDLPHLAIVTAIENGAVSTQSHLLCVDVPVISSISVQAVPQVGDEVVLIPTADGKYYCIGQVITDSLDDNAEATISSPSGAYIKLLSDGTISLNGLIISQGGTINGN